MGSSKVELPPGCIITDRRTWERQQRRVASLEAENRRLAQALQLRDTANEALRDRVAQAEDAALEAMTEAEELRNARSVKEVRHGRVKRALQLSLSALERVWAGATGRNDYGGTIHKALPAVRKALKDL